LLKTLFIFAGQKRTFYLCYLLLTFYLCYLQKDFSPLLLLTSQPLLIFFEMYTQKVKILARESVWGGEKRNLNAKSGNFS
jgi:hypothetical protein